MLFCTIMVNYTELSTFSTFVKTIYYSTRLKYKILNNTDTSNRHHVYSSLRRIFENHQSQIFEFDRTVAAVVARVTTHTD